MGPMLALWTLLSGSYTFITSEKGYSSSLPVLMCSCMINSGPCWTMFVIYISLQWRHNERDVVPNHRRPDCLLKRLFRRRSKKTSKLRVTGLYGGNSPVTGEFPTQRVSNAENVSIWWRHHDSMKTTPTSTPPLTVWSLTKKDPWIPQSIVKHNLLYWHCPVCSCMSS